MPEKKRSNRKTAGSGTRSGTAKKSAKKSSSKKSAAKRNPDNDFLPQIVPLILVACAVLLAVCLTVDQGVIGHGLRDVITGMLGGASYAVPVLLLVRALFLGRDRREGRAISRSFSACAFVLFLAMTMHILGGGRATLDAQVHYTVGRVLTGGGVVGGILGQLLVQGFGHVFSLIVLFALLFFLALHIAGISPRGAAVAVAYHMDRLIESFREKRAAEAEIRGNSGPTRNQVKEEEYLTYLREKREREREARRRPNGTGSAEEDPAPAPRGRQKNKRPSVAESQISMEEQPKHAATYRVRKRRLTELDIPVSGPSEDTDDVLLPVTAEKKEGPVEKDPDTGWAADAFRDPDDLSDPLRAELASPEADSAAVDEKIFDEIMQRTQERVAKNRRNEEDRMPEGPRRPAAKVQTVVSGGEPIPDDHLPEAERTGKTSRPTSGMGPKPAGPVFAGDAFDADRFLTDTEDDLPDLSDPEDIDEGQDPARDGPETEDDNGISAAVNAAAARKDGERFGQGAHKPRRIEAVETDTVSLVADVAEQADGDISDIFLNPEDAELLDRLSQQYRDPLEVKRETVSAPRAETGKQKAPEAPPYYFPPTDLLTEDPGGPNEDIKGELQENAVRLVDTLKSFRVNTKIENISRGPTITRYELVPEAGTKVRSITNLADDIALNLATTGVRIEAPIPGKSAVGIEVPNKNRTTVHLRKLLETDAFRQAKSRLTVALGEDVAGDAVYFDVGKMPHLLIAGTTGSGKSVCINTIIMSLLFKASPEDVKMILVDPKKVELNIYNGIPHLLVPVISEPKKAAGSLSWAVGEMERRYGLIEDAGKRNIGEYNKLAAANPDYEYLPSIVIIIDELADLMMTAKDDVEDSICRIAQKARAAGMYLIVGTQRPSVDVITGLIKANIPSRIAFRTSNQVDSRTIIDIGSAANLIGMGDMLFAPVGAMKPNRVQGAFVSEDEVLGVVNYIRNMNGGSEGYSDEILNQIEREAQRCGVGKKSAGPDSDEDEDSAEGEDPMLRPAVEVALDAGKISTSLIQRKLKLGYGRAAKLIDRMEQLGYVSAPDGNHPREVLITRSMWQELRMRDDDPPPFDV